MKDYTKLKSLLKEDETFLLRFTYKFIGRNSPKFQAAIVKFEAQFPTLQAHGSRLSVNQNHLAVTYHFVAAAPEAIIEIFQAIEKTEDLLMML